MRGEQMFHFIVLVCSFCFAEVAPSDVACRPQTMFRCGDGTCIPSIWKCDGGVDCIDSSDEHNCANLTCKPTEFQCGDGECIGGSWKCDGEPDCPDSSDEQNCTGNSRSTEPPLLGTTTTTAGTTATTLPNCGIGREWDEATQECVANDEADSRSTEPPILNTTIPTVGTTVQRVLHCERGFEWDEGKQECVANDEVSCNAMKCPDFSTCRHMSILNRAICVCNIGYLWNERTRQCGDKDECETRGRCSQICVNTAGSFRCECMEGYTLKDNGFCKADGGPEWMLLGGRNSIRGLNLQFGISDDIVDNTINSMTVDYDFEDNILFHSTDGGIKSTQIPKQSGAAGYPVAKEAPIQHTGDDANKEYVNETYIRDDDLDGSEPSGLAVDWLHKHVYWINGVTKSIKSATYDGSHVRTLIDYGMENPKSIVVDPEHGCLFWADCGALPVIQRIGLDGSDIVAVRTQDNGLRYPNGLAIDYVDKRLYWKDGVRLSIESSNLDGTDHVFVAMDATIHQYQYSLAVFEDSVYWVDWYSNYLRSVNKRTSQRGRAWHLGSSSSVTDIKLYQEKKQNTVVTEHVQRLCVTADCQHFCTAKPNADINARAYTACACSDGYFLNTDGKTCSPN